MDTVTPATVGISATRLERITDTLRRWVDAAEAPGFVALVARHGRAAYFEAVGRRDLEADAPMERDAIFRIYSMSKPITAAAVMMLLEEGHLLLDDPIADYIPDLGQMRVFAGEAVDGMRLVDPERPITIRHLLTHTSGLPYGSPSGDPVERAHEEAGILDLDRTLAQNVAALAPLPLAHQPGERWTYGISIDVLGRLVEVVSGQRFGAFLKERIFDPLGMADTGFDVAPSKVARIAPAYSRTDDGRLVLNRSALPVERPAVLESGGGGMVSTAADYFRFAQMLLGGQPEGARPLSPKMVDLMAAPQRYADGSLIRVSPAWSFSRGYAMALGVRTLVDVGELGLPGSVGSYNWEGAASTAFWIDPREDLVAVLMLQRLPGYARPYELFRSLVYGALEA